MESTERLCVLELYSGIGGMYYTLKSSVPAEVVAAVYVNTTANEIYKHNFPNTLLLPKTIEGMMLQDFDKLNFDVILMSPPCQPFTRDALLKTLREFDYSFQEFLISPTSLGIPNSRLRYFLIARRPPGSFSFPTSAEVVFCLDLF
uniref:tRNA (cytosine-5-)-methyltransferase-like n=1 Tax=Sinocyclocheilus anshuiensis TaxID=1608454 RepID=A0A671NSA4_9TELE